MSWIKESWIEAWSGGAFAGWMWATPKKAQSAMLGCQGFALFFNKGRIAGNVEEQPFPVHRAVGIPFDYRGYRWYSVWENQQYAHLAPTFTGWLYTKPKFDGFGSPTAKLDTFKCASILIVNPETGAVVG